MTAPPRPNMEALLAAAETMEEDDWSTMPHAVREAICYIEHLERRIEQLEATQREATWRPDMESDLD